MTAQEVIFMLLAGGLLGIIGQSMRVVVGLKKLYDQSGDGAGEFTSQLRASRLVLSMLIGFVAGALAILVLSPEPAALKLTRETMMTLIASGYAGTDFIEGFMKKHVPNQAEAANAQAAHDEPQAMG